MLQRNIFLFLAACLISACASTPRAAATASHVPLPAAETAIPKIDINSLKSFTFKTLLTGPATLVDGKAVQSGRTVSLLDQFASGDLNNDGQDDAAVLVQENYGGSKNLDLVVLLNQNGLALEAAGVSLGDGTQDISIHIKDGLVLLETKNPSAVVDDPCCSQYYRLAYQLAGESLNLVSQSSQTADGSTRSIEISAPQSSSLQSEALVIRGKYSIQPLNNTLFYSVLDSTGSEAADGERKISPSGSGEFSIPIDLSWVSPGRLRIEIRDAYSTNNTYAVLAFASTSIDFHPPTRTVLPPLFGDFKMIDENSGWALDADRKSILHTTDGGQTWQKTGFAGAPNVDLYGVNGTVAFALVGPADASEDLYRTTDGGKTWKKLPVILKQASLWFITPRQGWAMTNAECGAGTCMFDIYKTLDAGVSWQKMDLRSLHQPGERLLPEQVHLASGSGFSFVNASTIWLGGNAIISEKAIHLMVSHTAGRTWLKKEIALPAGDTTDMVIYNSLRFINSQIGYTLAQYSTGGNGKDPPQDKGLLVLTQDGGETWSTTRLPVPEIMTVNVAMISAREIFVWNVEQCFKTTDGGQTWNSAWMSPPFPGKLDALQFVSASTGFALVNEYNPAAQNTSLYKTRDGGDTWQKLDVHIQP